MIVDSERGPISFSGAEHPLGWMNCYNDDTVMRCII